MKSKKELLGFFLRFQRPYLRYAVGAGLLLLLFELLQLPTPFITRYLIDKVIPSGNFGLLHLFCGLLLGVIVVKQLSAYFMRLLFVYYKGNVHTDLEKSMYLHLQELPLSFFQQHPPGYLMSRISEITSADSLMADTLLMVLKDALSLLVGIAAILYLDFKIGLMSLAALPFFIYSIKYFHKKLKGVNRQLYETSAQYTSNLEKNLNAIEKIKTSVLEKKEGERIYAKLKSILSIKIRSERLNIFAKMIASSIAVIPPFAVIYYGVMEIMRGNLTLGSFIAINTFVAGLFGPAQSLTEMGYSFSRSFAGMERVYELFNLPVEDNGGEPIDKIEDIRFRNVTFSYDGKTDVLNDLSFHIKNGEKIGIVGKSGMGKSTIVKLILRLMDCNSGSIMVSGRHIQSVQRKSLRRKIAYISQSLMLLDDDIRERIDGRDVRAILKRFKLNLDNKNAFKQELSGGEIQRLEIAEHLARDADLLILDEGTSNLDYESERQVLQALLQKFRDKTVIVIAHRLHSISEFERLLVLEDGQIKEEGTHRQLLEQNGIYRNLYNSRRHPSNEPIPGMSKIRDITVKIPGEA